MMSEIETKRNQAIKAEDNIKELNRLIEGLQRWFKDFEARVKGGEKTEWKEEVFDREGEVEQVQELCRELKTQRVGYPEKSVADLLLAWTKTRELYEAVFATRKDKRSRLVSVPRERGGAARAVPCGAVSLTPARCVRMCRRRWRRRRRRRRGAGSW